MPDIGKGLSAGEVRRAKENLDLIREQEEILAREIERVKNAGIPAEKIHDRGGMTIHDRLDYLVHAGTWNPLHSLYNPVDNEEGCTGVVNGLGKIEGKWAVIIGFDNKVMAGRAGPSYSPISWCYELMRFWYAGLFQHATPP